MKLVIIFVLLACFLCVSSCVYHERYFKTKEGSDNDFRSFVVQFKDDGKYWSEKDATKAIDYIKDEATNKNVVVLLFAHGWHHNAYSKDGNYLDFQKTLAGLTEKLNLDKYKQARLQLTGDENVEVVGIYLGWRGRSLKKAGDVFTVWGRKKAAIRVGGGDAQEFLKRLNGVYTSSYNSNNRNFLGLVAVGHSLGGQLLLKASSEKLESSLKNTSNSDNMVQGLGDLVVLLNPAAESRQFNNLNRLLRSHKGADGQEPYSELQTPELLVVSGKGDTANIFWFPLSRILVSPFRIFHWDNIQSLGNYKAHVTHSLEKTKSQCPEGFLSEDVYINKAKDMNSFDFTAGACFGGALLEPVDGFNIKYSPIVVAKTKQELLVKGHNGIFGENFRDFLTDYVAYIQGKKMIVRGEGNKIL